jgi:hypothetical protein
MNTWTARVEERGKPRYEPYPADARSHLRPIDQAVPL